MDIVDILLIISIIAWILLISYLKISNNKNKEDYMEDVRKAKKDMLDLEKITKNIEKNYKPINVDLTKYEKEQENNAIISYDELLVNREKETINYDDSYNNETDINVRKVNLEDNIGSLVEETTIKVNLMNYEKEEAFLKALKKLQSNLIR